MAIDATIVKIDAEIAKLELAAENHAFNKTDLQDKIDALKLARRLRLNEVSQFGILQPTAGHSGLV